MTIQPDANSLIDALSDQGTRMQAALTRSEEVGRWAENLSSLASTHARSLQDGQRATGESLARRVQETLPTLASTDLGQQAADYMMDAAQRWILFLDILRKRGNTFIGHEEAGCPPVLAYDYDVIIDGRTLERPVNYALVRIKPDGDVTQREDGRPYIIIDPRAGHGSGIGGFKSESEVGAALNEGHPVYFVIFFTHPEPTQTLADVTRAEARFVREVQRRHPDSPKPIIVGNCQGGWAAMLLAATNPDITGPVVANGAPLSYWSGVVGRNPMRYLGGMVGGVLPVMMLSDLGGGQFDGANLVLNFETLNPGNTWWRKYYDVFGNVDTEAPRYLEFERWWSGFYFMNEAEIRWIVDNLFVGNKLARGQANLDARTHVDLRNIRTPIIIFASHGDNITPPQQALNWIADCYKTVQEIKARGQRILYTIHPNIGHLGIFVSSTVAKKQHKEIVSTLKTIEALAPGLYEMVITDEQGEGADKRFTVAFEERSIDDVLGLDDNRDDEDAFAPVARLSELSANLYDLTVRPLVRSMVTPPVAKAAVQGHPLRQRRYFMSDRNPMLTGLGPLADQVRDNRRPANDDNAFVRCERLWADIIAEGWNMLRDSRDAAMELMFYGVYGSPMARALGGSHAPRMSDMPQEDLRTTPEVRMALETMSMGGFAEAVIRMLILLAKSRGSVRRDRLEKSNTLLSDTEPFRSLGIYTRNKIIHLQSLMVEFEPDQALATLAHLVPDGDDRLRALAICEDIAGPVEEMSKDTVAMLNRIRAALAMPQATVTAAE